MNVGKIDQASNPKGEAAAAAAAVHVVEVNYQQELAIGLFAFRR
jgi:hypothetical protein